MALQHGVLNHLIFPLDMSSHKQKQGDNASDELQAEASSFLERDFNQCFSQLRHYDNQIWDICKFTFTSYTVLIGIAVGLYQYSNDLLLTSGAVLAVGLLFGLFMFSLSVRNRVYFTLVTRYINEHRNFFLEQKPLGFKNKTKMYTNASQPPYFNWRSSQSFFFYIIATLNSILLAVLSGIVLPESKCKWIIVIAISVGLLLVQIATAILYLLSRENQSASEAVFGTK